MELKFAIIGIGSIADRVAKGIINSRYATLYAVASRDENKAISFAKKYNLDKAYGNYDDVLNDEDVDVVYIATINSTHLDLIKRCADHHKNVICEKPLVKDAKETNDIFDYCRERNVFLLEAQKACFTSLNTKIHALINDGIIGQVKVIYASFTALENYPKEHHIMDKEYGGVFKDIGVYPIAYANYMSMSSIKDIEILELIHNEDGIDVSGKLHLSYENDVDAYVRTSFLAKVVNFAVIKGSKGTIMLEDFWKSDKAYIIRHNRMYEIKVNQVSEFTGEIDHLCICLFNGIMNSHVYGKKDSVEVAKVVDYIKKVKDEKRCKN